jgi:AcrR family transcriptional regulator
MNEKFFELPQEKQLRIINAGFEIFSQNDYKRASTEQIAIKADISKGLLFYYFHNKKTLYLFLFEYAEKLIKSYVFDSHFSEISDFFELCEYAAECKYKLIQKNPHIMNFVVRGFYSQKEDVTAELNKKMQIAMSGLSSYFKKIDFSKFKSDIDPQDILHMLTWLTDGYIHEKQRDTSPLGMSDLMKEYRTWTAILKKASYKEDSDERNY